MHHDELLFATTILLTVSIAAVVLFQRAGFGSVLGLLAAGVVVGPSGLAVTDQAELLGEIAEIGIVFLLFIIGLEMDPMRLWSMRRTVFGLGFMQVLVTAVVLTAGATLFGNPFIASLVMGLGLALSSTAFVMQLLEENGEVLTPHGETAFGILLFQDLAIVPLLMLVVLLGPATGDDAGHASGHATPHSPVLMIVMLVAVIVAGRYVMPAAMAYVASRRQPGLFSGLAVLAVVLSAWAMVTAGLSMALGAFLMGMLLSRSHYKHQIEADVAPYKGLLLSLFFVTIGMSINLAVLGDNLFLILLVVVCIIVAKFFVLLLLARIFGCSTPDALRVALLLAQAGEFGFVMFGAARAVGILSEELFVQTVLVISISMAATPVLARAGSYWARRFGDKGDGGSVAAQALQNHVVICGYGRIGRTVAAMLEACEVPFVAIEQDAARLNAPTRHNVVFGNAADRQMLASLGLGRAAMVVVTLDSSKAARQIVSIVRTFYPGLPILVRARDLSERDALRLAGANTVLPETIEHALALGQAALRQAGIDDQRADMVTDQLCMDDYANLRALDASAVDHAPGATGERL